MEDDSSLEVNQAAVAIMREYRERLDGIQAQIKSESSYRKRRQLQREFLAEVTRQEAALSEVPGLAGQAAALAVLRERVKLFFRLD